MEIGVLGTGMVGQTIGSRLVQLGHQVMLGSRIAANPKAIAWANEEGSPHALYGTFKNAAKFGEIIFNCTLGTASLDVLQQAGVENLKGKILIDVSNPIDYSAERIYADSLQHRFCWASKSNAPFLKRVWSRRSIR